MRYGGIKSAVFFDGTNSVSFDLVSEDSEFLFESEADENIDGEYVYQGEIAELGLETLDLDRTKYEQLLSWNRAGTQITAFLTGQDNQRVYFDEPARIRLERGYSFAPGESNRMKISIRKYGGSLDVYLRKHNDTSGTVDSSTITVDDTDVTAKGYTITG